MREDVACADSGWRFLPEQESEPVHYTASTLITAYGETQTVAGWAEDLGDEIRSLLRRLNAFTMLPPEVVLELPKCIRIRNVPLGAPKSWTWDVLPWEADRWAQAWVDAHPGGATLDEVGQAIGVTRERVRQVEQMGMRKFVREARRSGVGVEDMLGVLREMRERRAEVAL